MRNWHQHPEVSLSLLKYHIPLSQYEPESEIMLAESQPADYRDYRSTITNPEVFLFKLLTMTNTVVQEEFSFTFDVRAKYSEDDR